MKSLIIALTLISGSLWAYEHDATEVLLSTLPAGEYQGKTIDGRSCGISVSAYPGKVVVTARTEGKLQRSEVKHGALYRWNPGNRSFLASTIYRSGDVVSENILRTIAVTSTTQYVVVADLVMKGRTSSETMIECNINL